MSKFSAKLLKITERGLLRAPQSKITSNITHICKDTLLSLPPLRPVIAVADPGEYTRSGA